MSPSKMIDAEFAYLEGRVAALEKENAELRRENGDLLMKWINAQDLATVRMVQAFVGLVDGVPVDGAHLIATK